LYRNNFRWPGVFQFLRDEHGVATMEFVLWMPVFFFILVIATDATVLYLQHTEMWNVSRYVVRRISVGDLTEAEAVEVVKGEMFLARNTYAVLLSDPARMDVRVMILTRIKEASMFGFFNHILGRYLVATVVMRREPR